MTTNKPEIVAYLHSDKEDPKHKGVSLHYDMSYTYPLVNTEPLIRLSDYEALQADRDQQYNMKVKARKQRDEVTTKLSALYTECEKLRKDAERYRWLRDGNNVEDYSEAISIALHHYGDEWDEMIDIAMEEKSK